MYAEVLFVLFLIVVTFSFVTVNQVIFWEDWVFCTSQEIGWGEGVSEQCFTSLSTQYRLYGKRFLQVKRPNQQYQSTEGDATKEKENNENN